MKFEENNTILLDRDEVIRLCKPGEATNTCIWLMLGSEGFCCHYYNRPKGLVSRWNQGLTNAKRNGCDEVKELGLEIKYVEAPTLEEYLRR